MSGSDTKAGAGGAVEDPSGTKPARSTLPRLGRWIDEAMRRRNPRRSTGSDVGLLCAAVVLFVAGTVLSYAQLPQSDAPVQPRWLLLVALIGVPLTILLNGAEYDASARLLGHRIPFLEAIRVSVLGTAANLLPIPGSFLVRVRGLARLGSTVGRAVSSTGITGMIWIGMTGLIAGASQLASGRIPLGAGLLTVGLGALLAVGVLLATSGTAAPSKALVYIAAVESGLVLISMLRQYFALRGLGVSISLAQAATLTLAGVLASAAGFMPGGLGLRELIAAAMSPLVGLPPTVGFVAAALDRLVGLVTLSPVSAALLVRYLLRRPIEIPCIEPTPPASGADAAPPVGPDSTRTYPDET